MCSGIKACTCILLASPSYPRARQLLVIADFSNNQKTNQIRLAFGQGHACVRASVSAGIHAMPCHAMPCNAMPCHAMPCHAMPCHAILCHAMPCHPTQRHAKPCHACMHACHAMPCHAMLCNAMPCHAMPCNDMAGHEMPWHDVTCSCLEKVKSCDASGLLDLTHNQPHTMQELNQSVTGFLPN